METRGKLCVESIGQAKSEKFSETLIRIVRLHSSVHTVVEFHGEAGEIQ